MTANTATPTPDDQADAEKTYRFQTTMTTFAFNGTVSHGTLNPRDLIPAFMTVLRVLSPEKHAALSERERVALCAVNGEYNDDPDYTPEALATELEGADELVSDLIDTLDTLAPDGYMFGSVEGDASDFGFWLNEDGEDELNDDGSDIDQD